MEGKKKWEVLNILNTDILSDAIRLTWFGCGFWRAGDIL